MNKLEAIYTRVNDCQDCYKCVRHCPVKAIKIENHAASVIPEQCIFCGKCVQVCPAGAKKIRNDVQTVSFLLKQDKPVVLSLAPSYMVDFDDYSKQSFIRALKKMGFAHVSETALGADIVSSQLKDWLSSQDDGVYISSCCPSVVHLIQKYYPHLSGHITPFKSPAQTHASYLREYYGDVNIVFAGPCVAKKTELKFPGNQIDVAITFKELNDLLQSLGLENDFVKPDGSEQFEPVEAGTGRIYPVDGGMINAMNPDISATDSQFLSFSGVPDICAILDNLPRKVNHKLFLELMTCSGGCINGPGRVKKSTPAQSRMQVIMEKNTQPKSPPVIGQSIGLQYDFMEPVPESKYSNEEIEETLKEIGKFDASDELNCGGCGYYTCRQFAAGILDEKAERQMCVSYMRKLAQNKASVLMQKIPYGFVIVNDHLKIVESNKIFAGICGEEISSAYANRPGLEGADIRKVTPIWRLFQNLLVSGHDRIEKHVHFGNKTLHVSVFTLHKYKQVCAIIQNPDNDFVTKSEVLKSLQTVIRTNMLTAQKVAGLLGETAAETECSLNKIMDAFN